MPRTPLPAVPAVHESRLRSRSTGDNRPTEQIPQKQRALCAAEQVLSGALSPGEAMSKFMVNHHSLKYYRLKLLEQGIPDMRAKVSTTPDTNASIAAAISARNSEASNYTSAWDEYVHAYIFAGGLVMKYGRRQAAALATEKYGVHVSATSAGRAAKTPGEGPKRCGASPIIPMWVEHRLVVPVPEFKLPPVPPVPPVPSPVPYQASISANPISESDTDGSASDDDDRDILHTDEIEVEQANFSVSNMP